MTNKTIKTETEYSVFCCHNGHKDLLRGLDAVRARLNCTLVEASTWIGIREQLGLQLFQHYWLHTKTYPPGSWRYVKEDTRDHWLYDAQCAMLGENI